MLSTEECREHLGLTDLTDEQIERLRDALYVFVEKLVDEYIDNTGSITNICRKHSSTAESPQRDNQKKVMV